MGVLRLLALVVALLAVAGQSLICQDQAWEKVRGVRPVNVVNRTVLYTGVDSQGIVSTCFQKCKSLNCSAFIVDLEKSACFGVEPSGGEFMYEPNATFYHKICLKVPASCLRTRLWQVERNLGAFLFDSMAQILKEPITRRQCYEACINNRNCRSAQFRTSQDLWMNDTVGHCALLTIERGIKPQSFRASMFRDEYLEYQCHNISKRDYCSYAEYRNASIPFSDFKISNITAKECEARCDNHCDGFLCRAYGYEYNQRTKNSSCFLHSEDTMGTGISTLLKTPGSFYKEREPCIDMSVLCTNSSLTVELRTNEPFNGRIYASGYSETCGAQGLGEKITKLVLPLPETTNYDSTPMSCGLAPAYSVDQDNQTRAVIWSTVIVQFNPIIQRLGDQAVRVGCSLDDSGEVPSPQNVTVHSSFTFTDSNAGMPSVVSTVMNTSSEVPVVSMSILDAKTRNRANVTHLGQKLLLKIDISSSQGPYFDIMAGHLTASTDSGASSFLLLDESGCPVTTVFPALLKDPTDNRSLVAEFEAFKFPNSQHVRFNVIIKFCLDQCEPAKCVNVPLLQPSISYGRRRRDVPANVTEIKHPDNDTMQLTDSIIVYDDRNIYTNPLRAGDQPDTLLILEPGSMQGKFCMNASLMLFLLIFLLIIQIILIGSCVLAVRTYRRMAMRAEEDRADILAKHLYGIHSGGFEISRRVRWADNNDSTLS